MASKVISVSLMLSYFFSSATGELKITEEQYVAFKGVDPLKNCNNPQAMKTMCTTLGKPDGALDFFKGYPDCEDYNMLLEKSCGGTVVKKTKFLICGWNKPHGTVYLVYGKGQSSNHVMSYVPNCNGDHFAYGEVPYNGS